MILIEAPELLRKRGARLIGAYRGSQKLSVLFDAIIALDEIPGVSGGAAFSMVFEKNRRLSKSARSGLKIELETDDKGSRWLFEESADVRVVALDLPTSWILAAPADEFTGRMFAAVNSMMLDVLAAVARKDYEDRRRRQAQGQEKAKAAGLYRGRVENTARNAGIAAMLRAGQSWSSIQAATGCSRATIAKVAKRE